MQVKDVMTRDVEIVHPDATLKEAAELMREADVGFLPIGEDDRLVGTLTDRDIAVRSTALGQDPTVTRVRDAMSERLVYCFEEDDAIDAAAVMSQEQIRRLPVLNQDKRIVGVVSIGDLAVKGEDEETVGQTVGEISQPSAKSVF